MLARSRRRCLASVSNRLVAAMVARPTTTVHAGSISCAASAALPLQQWQQPQQRCLSSTKSSPLVRLASSRPNRAAAGTGAAGAAWRRPLRRQRISAGTTTTSSSTSSTMSSSVLDQNTPVQVQPQAQAPHKLLVDWEILNEAEQDNEEDEQEVELEPTEASLNEAQISIVEAFYAAKTIDLAPLAASNLDTLITRRKYNKDNLLLELAPTTAIAADNTSSNNANTNNGNPSYVAIYRFGSVIFFNVSPRIQVQMLRFIKKHALEPVPPGFEQKDTFNVCVMPHITRSRVTSEHCIVPNLNMNALAVISEVMAQSVALESYNEIVDSLLEKFAVINSNIAATSSTMDLDKSMLFSKIAQNNRIFIDLISKIRIKKRNQIAWDQMEFEVIHSGMTREFDIDDRFELIQFKLDLIQQNSKLFLEVIQHQKSASLEWVIVVLIGFECGLMILEMTGQGSVLFHYVKTLLF